MKATGKPDSSVRFLPVLHIEGREGWSWFVKHAPIEHLRDANRQLRAMKESLKTTRIG